MTQLLTYAQATLLDKLLETETPDHVMFIRYEHGDYLTQYPELFDIDPIDLMRALSTGYIAYADPIEKWRARHRLKIADSLFVGQVDETELAAEYRAVADTITEIDADFGLGIIEKESSEK